MAVTLLKQEEVAEILCCNTHQVTKIRNDGLLPGLRFGRRYLYLQEDVDRLIKISRDYSISTLTEMNPDSLKKLMNSYSV